MVKFILGASIMLNLVFLGLIGIYLSIIPKIKSKIDEFGLPDNLDIRNWDFNEKK